ncbi:MAG: LysE family translocator [Actinomycetales bacterium]
MQFPIPARYPEYLVAAVLIILAPGPSVLFAIARAIAWGRATAIATVAGNALGMFSLSILIAFGLGPILERSELAFISVQILGGLYLIYLGIDALRHSKVHAEDMVNQGDIKPKTLKSIRDGFWVGALNPKGLVFFAAILPQFLDKNDANLTVQLLIMGATFALLAFIGDGIWGILAGTARVWMANSPVRLIRLRQLGGVVIVLLGVFTLISAA